MESTQTPSALLSGTTALIGSVCARLCVVVLPSCKNCKASGDAIFVFKSALCLQIHILAMST